MPTVFPPQTASHHGWVCKSHYQILKAFAAKNCFKCCDYFILAVSYTNLCLTGLLTGTSGDWICFGL